jgi:hypothetical protein
VLHISSFNLLDFTRRNYSYYKFTTSLLTVLDLFCPASPSLSLISLSDPSLSVSSVSHPLKRILCRLKREHLLEEFSLSVHENTSVYLQHLTIGCLGNQPPMYALLCERVCHPDNDTGNLVTDLLSSNGQPLPFRYSGF